MSASIFLGQLLATDGTVEILRDIAAKDPCAKIILNARNFGIVRSSANCFFSSSGDAVFMFLPADMQDPPELIPQFVQLWEQGYDVVHGMCETRQELKIMVAVRKLYYFLLCGLSSLKLPLNLGDFQLLDKRIVDAMRTADDVYPFGSSCRSNARHARSGFPINGAHAQAALRKTGFSI